MDQGCNYDILWNFEFLSVELFYIFDGPDCFKMKKINVLMSTIFNNFDQFNIFDHFFLVLNLYLCIFFLKVYLLNPFNVLKVMTVLHIWGFLICWHFWLLKIPKFLTYLKLLTALACLIFLTFFVLFNRRQPSQKFMVRRRQTYIQQQHTT